MYQKSINALMMVKNEYPLSTAVDEICKSTLTLEKNRMVII